MVLRINLKRIILKLNNLKLKSRSFRKRNMGNCSGIFSTC